MVWNHFFDLKSKTFKKNKYEFNYIIRTYGISVCVLFILLVNGKPMSKIKRNNANELYIMLIMKKI